MTRRNYDSTFKREALALVRESGSVVQTAETLGIPHATLHKWSIDAGIIHPAAARTQVIPEHDERSVDELQAELRALRAENAQLREDNEFLGKASAYFAERAKRGSTSFR